MLFGIMNYLDVFHLSWNHRRQNVALDVEIYVDMRLGWIAQSPHIRRPRISLFVDEFLKLFEREKLLAKKHQIRFKKNEKQ